MSSIGNVPPGSSNAFGSPNLPGDGINWPYNPTGQTPQLPNDPNMTALQKYEYLLNWLKNNIGSPGFYNGCIELLQMTTDLGAAGASFLKSQIEGPGGETFLQMIIDVAAEGAAVSQNSLADGIVQSEKFLAALANATKGLAHLGPPFSQMYDEAMKQEQSIGKWCVDHWVTSTDPLTGKTISSWMYIDSDGTYHQINNFDEFSQYAQLELGLALVPPGNDNPSVNSVIDSFYQQQIQELVEKFKGNPWALLAALMSLMNQRDQDNGVALNGYAGTLDAIKGANNIIQKMLGDLSGATPNAADFFKQMDLLKKYVGTNPALASVWDQLKSQIGTIEGQSVGTYGPNNPWTVGPGEYHFPPGARISVQYPNGQRGDITVPPSGIVYVSQNSIFRFDNPTQVTFGMAVAMGDVATVQKLMGQFSSIVMTNFTNGVTGLQSLLNSMSPAIQTQIQNKTQTMQATENFEKLGYQSISDVNAQINRMIQAVMG